LIQSQTLGQYLEACHSLDVSMVVVTDRSLTTQGDTTNPTGRIFPERIVPWIDFAAKQEEIWDLLSANTHFSSEPTFPSLHQLDFVRSVLRPITSEIGLRNFEHVMVENMVQRLVDEVYKDALLRQSLGLDGTVTFESHTNLGATVEDPADTDNVDVARPVRPEPLKARRQARGKGSQADQFCIYRASDGGNVPVLAIEYKAPHKLSIEEIAVGLEIEIRPAEHVINKDGHGFAFSSRALAAAVITQCFSYMIGKGIRYGYVCTGQAFVFLYIPDDPSIVYYSVCVPSLDVMEGDEARLHRTAVAQVFAFILQALRADSPPQSWHDAAEKLEIWAVEYDDVLRNIPETVRKERPASPYKPQHWKPFKRSPIRTRSRCKLDDDDVDIRDTDDDEDPPSPTPTRPRSRGVAASSGRSGSSGTTAPQGGQQQDHHHRGQATKPKIQDRPFCTQQCLLGLANGGPIDETCPNSEDHGRTHINKLVFLELIRHQLYVDRGRDADCAPLHLSGSRGSIFKVRLTSHGYTLVAKAMEEVDRAHFRTEISIYDKARSIQGIHIPVCLGNISLDRPQYYDSGVYVHLIFLSWAGRPLLHQSIDPANAASLTHHVALAFQELHKLRILHHDARPSNILYDRNSGRLMVIDFERAEYRGYGPLGLISPNQQSRKRKYEALQKQQRDDFVRELQFAMDGVNRLIHAVTTQEI
jgi:tRNA A-37 threonylcarbamoyl transferase component Bud32